MNVAWTPIESPRPTFLGGVTAHAGVRIDFGFFYDELAPFGDWRWFEPYGWVWYPNVADDWRPYTFGYWVFTDDYGWTWISTDPWGSVPFHYGRWFFDEDYGGWAWVPGTEWGPAWVGWRSGGGYIGWAPLPPDVEFEPGVGFSSGQDFSIGWNSWCFVPTPQFLSPRIERFIVPRPRNVTLMSNTVNVTRYTVIDRRVVNRSIDLGRFEGETRTRVVRYRVADADRPVVRETPVRDGQVMLFRPQVVRTKVAPPTAVVRPSPGAQPDYHPERRAPGMVPGEPRMGDWDQDRSSRPGSSGADRYFPNGPRRPIEFEERDGQRPHAEQERPRQRQAGDQGAVEEQRRQAEQERAKQWIERGQIQQQTIIQRQQTEREQARQQAILQRQQAEQEQAR
ncbi:MAG: hypothetical protein RKR03_07630, partial [Candidatus Competibacter sp.]|nr:hypothetical protein [Candidatus Competibacter sp.]